MGKRAVILLIMIFLTQSCLKDAPEDMPRQSHENQDYVDKLKILYIDSYHPDYFWSRGIMKGIFSFYNLPWIREGEVALTESPVHLRVHHMNTLIDHSPDYLAQAVKEARDVIDFWKPDVVIASDDNASKYLIAPYYLNDRLPFVFCGINWNIEPYGFPAENITGIVSVHQIVDLVEALLPYAEGKEITYLRSDDTTSRQEIDYLESTLSYPFKAVLVNSYKMWQEEYLKLQKESGMILAGYPSSYADWDGDDRKLHRFMMDNTQIPTGSWDTVMAPHVLVSITNSPEEQGEWAAETALRIARGTAPSDIEVAQNRKGAYYTNMLLANKLDIQFPLDLIEKSHMINTQEENKKVYYVNSYHKGYEWSDYIEETMLKALSQSDLFYDVKIFRLNGKAQISEDILNRRAGEAYEEILAWNPDIILGSDDRFINNLVIPYLSGGEYPVLYCGLNGPPPPPSSWITGMVEVDPLVESVSNLRQLAAGDRLGLLFQEEPFNHAIHSSLLARGELSLDRVVFAPDFFQWKEEYLKMQEAVDMLIFYNPVGMKGWNGEEALTFIRENTSIPVGTTIDTNIRLALMGNMKTPEEQGWWLGKTAVDVLKGKAVKDIPQAQNSGSRLVINTEMAESLNYKIPLELIKEAQLWPMEQMEQ